MEVALPVAGREAGFLSSACKNISRGFVVSPANNYKKLMYSGTLGNHRGLPLLRHSGTQALLQEQRKRIMIAASTDNPRSMTFSVAVWQSVISPAPVLSAGIFMMFV